MPRLTLQAVAIGACNYLLCWWYRFVFGLGEFLIAPEARMSGEDYFWYWAPLLLLAAGLGVIGFLARRWPFGEVALAICWLFVVLAREAPFIEWPSFLAFFVCTYLPSLAIACGGQALWRRRTRSLRG